MPPIHQRAQSDKESPESAGSVFGATEPVGGNVGDVCPQGGAGRRTVGEPHKNAPGQRMPTGLPG